MTDYGSIIKKYESQLKKALKHLEYSYIKIQKLPLDPKQLGEEELETWESFSSRFSRVVDLFLTKYIKAIVLKDDPGFSGTVRDFANQAERLELIASANEWMQYRELRNIEAHTYEEELERFLGAIKKNTPQLLKVNKIL